MSKEECYSVGRCPMYRRAKAFRQLSFLHHSTFGVGYSAVLFRVHGMGQSMDVFRASFRKGVTYIII